MTCDDWIDDGDDAWVGIGRVAHDLIELRLRST